MKHINIIFVLLLFSQFNFAQNRKVSGVVKDSTGFLLPGITVLVEGTNNYTQTDSNGAYVIKANSDQFLIFSMLGMHSQRVSAAKNKIDVILQIDHTILNEVIAPDVPGHNLKRKNALGAITTVSAEDIKEINNPNYNFEKNCKNDRFIIFASNLKLLENKDFDFQSKYKVMYSQPMNYSIEYVKIYNKLTFEYLKRHYKKFKKSEIRKDAFGLEDF